MNGFGFFSLCYSLRIDSASLCESAFSKKKVSYFYSVLFPYLSWVRFPFWFWNSSQFLRQLVKIYRLQKNHSIGENKMVR